MSQQTIYKCDQCRKEIGDKIHITLMLSRGPGTGIAVPKPHWHTEQLNGNFLHFHSGKCIGEYFDALIKKQQLPAKKK